MFPRIVWTNLNHLGHLGVWSQGQCWDDHMISSQFIHILQHRFFGIWMEYKCRMYVLSENSWFKIPKSSSEKLLWLKTYPIHPRGWLSNLDYRMIIDEWLQKLAAGLLFIWQWTSLFKISQPHLSTVQRSCVIPFSWLVSRDPYNGLL